MLKGRSLVTIDDLTTSEIGAIFSAAGEMEAAIGEQSKLCKGKIMASLFFEPSTRTRLSFEAAMYRLGGNVITAADIGATSLAKGESLADMARIVGSYADIIVIRHPWEGAAKVVADYAGVPVINAGDGGHQHPTQTMLDLYTIRKERKTIKGLKIALWGDLKYGRTIHSLIFALAKFGASILFCPTPGLEVPEHVLQKLVTEYGGEIEKCKPANQTAEERVFPVYAIYTTASSSHQLAMMSDVNLPLDLGKVDAIYVTRPQKERFAASESELTNQTQVVDKNLLKGKEFRSTLIMHPLPRVDELAYDLDTDPRSQYFKQAAYGVPVRMAILALLSGAKPVPVPESEIVEVKVTFPAYNRDSGLKCSNPKCVSIQKTELKYLHPEFKIVNYEPLTLRCVYCEHGFEPKYIATTEWHEGTVTNKKYHPSDSHWAKTIKPENLIIFASSAEAEAQGFKPNHNLGGKN